ncbi:MAG: TlpA family protein disulfide reductase [Acidimicrobiia bacterium]|nr:TlpA family protein disulfide reductase [Acidimicrobiia bacterium]
MDETQPPEPGPGDQAEPIEPEAIDSRRRLLPVAIVVALLLMAVPVVLWVTSSEPQPVVSVVPNDDASTAESAPEPADLPGIVESGLAPDFDAELLDGGSYRLSDHLANDGRPVFLNLWASWCFPCREEMPAIDALAGAHPEILFLGVAIEDSLSGAKGFAEEIGVTYPLAFDETNEVSDRYPILGLPGTFLISADGELVAKLIGGASMQTMELFLGHLN